MLTQAHFAPNCATFSRAAEIPIPGVVMSLQSPSGAPSTPRNVSNSQRGHASGWTGSARRCIVRHKKGLPFSLEHPGRSIALDLEEWKSLMSIEGVYAPSITPVCSTGSRRRKYQILIHNQKELQALGRECP